MSDPLSDEALDAAGINRQALVRWARAKLLPSELLDMARARNPEVFVDIDWTAAGPPTAEPKARVRCVLVRTARGEARTPRLPSEQWIDTFRRAGLL